MNCLTVLAVLVTISGYTYGATFYSCNWITSSNVNCDLFTANPSCGTDLVTYKNKCEFSREHCKDTSIDLLHAGPCTEADLSSGSVAGAEVVFDFFCTTLSKQDCPTDVTQVCASDGRTYMNYCEYEKQKCTHRDLAIVSYGVCIA